MIFWLIELRCFACPWTDRTMHTEGDVLDYTCPRCKSPINDHRLIGLIGEREDAA